MDNISHNSSDNSVEYTKWMDKTLLGVSYAAIIDTELYKSPELDVQKGQQLQQQSRLVVVSGRTHSIVANVLDKGFGDRKADDQLRTLLDNAFKGRDDLNRVNDNLWRGFAVFTTNTDGNRFQQISRHIAKQSAQNKPSIWFMISGLRPYIWDSVPALMTIPAFKASVETSAQMLSPLGVDGIECLTETIDWKNELNEHNIHRAFIAAAVHHMAFMDAMRAVGVTPDGYLGSSLGELMCLYLDGLCDRRQFLAMCAAVRPPVSDGRPPVYGFLIGQSWPEIQRLCEGRRDIYPAEHMARNLCGIAGNEAPVRELHRVLRARGVEVRPVSREPDPFHTEYMFEPNIGAALVAQFTKVVPERTHSRPTNRWLSSSRPTLREVSTSDGCFSPAECFANILLSPVLFNEAVDRLPADALVLNVATDCKLRAVALTGRVQELYVKEEVSTTPSVPVMGINHLLREIGLVFTAGHWPRVHDLMASV